MPNMPLAERLRPKNLDEYIGQQHLVGVIVNQVSAEVNHPVNAQLVVFSNLHNMNYVFLQNYRKPVT